jgi:hypothetical protein
MRANVLYVKAGAQGNGLSWSDAIGDLQQALKIAKAGDQIWVASGKYLPTTCTNRTISFNIPDGVELYGGFVGHEVDVDARDWKANRTILSGEIGTPALDDNSFTVVLTENVSGATLVDGFIITSGAANDPTAKGELGRCGGGWLNRATNGESNPTIANCSFENNFGREGAGLYNLSQNGTASPALRNCRFIQNKAVLDGGAIYNYNNGGVASLYITDCTFEKNEATYGAAIYNKSGKSAEKSVVSNSSFIGNICYIKGNNIYNLFEGAENEPIVKNCRFMDGTNGNTETSLKDAKAEIVYKPGF